MMIRSTPYEVPRRGIRSNFDGWNNPGPKRPKLNLLGVREPGVYGRDTLEDIKRRCVEQAKKHGLEVEFHQSNSEATLIDWLHEARGSKIGVAINPAGLSFHR